MVGGRTGAVTVDQDGSLLVRQASLGGAATTLAGTASDELRSLEGLQHVGFVYLGHPGQDFGLDVPWHREKPVAPAESGARRHSQALCCSVYSEPVGQRPGLVEPLALVAQTGARAWRSAH